MKSAAADTVGSGLAALDLDVSTEIEFVALMRSAQKASGLNPGQIHRKAGEIEGRFVLPRSTAYKFVHRSQTRIPTRYEQVRAFFLACELTRWQIEAVMDRWRSLDQARSAALESALNVSPLPPRAPEPTESSAYRGRRVGALAAMLVLVPACALSAAWAVVTETVGLRWSSAIDVAVVGLWVLATWDVAIRKHCAVPTRPGAPSVSAEAVAAERNAEVGPAVSTPVAAVPADAIPAEPQAQATDSDQEIVRDAAALNRAAVAVMKQRGTVIPQQQALNILNASKGHKIAAALSQQPAIPQGAFGTLPAVPQGGLQFPNLMEDHSPAAKALDAARSKVGAQYSWGAAGPVSFDCSGLVQWAFRQAGVELPRTSFEQSHVGAPVAFQNLQPGDIVITNGGGHVGIYAGDGKLLNAVQSGTPVSYTHLDADDVVTARRVV